MEPKGNTICQVYQERIGERSTNVTKKFSGGSPLEAKADGNREVPSQGSLIFMEIEQLWNNIGQVVAFNCQKPGRQNYHNNHEGQRDIQEVLAHRVYRDG